MQLILQVFLIISFIISSYSCELSGKQIGKCAKNPLTSNNFCFDQISKYICIPAFNTTWSQYDTNYKDSIIQQKSMQFLQTQLINEYMPGSSTLRISNNPSCYENYKKFVCNWNFPACDSQNKSIVICQSICNSFQTACGGNTDVCEITYSKTVKSMECRIQDQIRLVDDCRSCDFSYIFQRINNQGVIS